MHQFIGYINDRRVGGLEPLLNYMNENFFSKGDPAINGHHYYITKNNTMKRYIIFTMSIKRKTFNIKNTRFSIEQYFNKQQKCT